MPREVTAEDLRDVLLTKDQVGELTQTREGREFYAAWIMYQRVEYGVARLLNRLGVPAPTKEVQREICSDLWLTVMAKPPWEIIEEMEMAKQIIDSGLSPIDYEDLLRIRPVGGDT